MSAAAVLALLLIGAPPRTTVRFELVPSTVLLKRPGAEPEVIESPFELDFPSREPLRLRFSHPTHYEQELVLTSSSAPRLTVQLEREHLELGVSIFIFVYVPVPVDLHFAWRISEDWWAGIQADLGVYLQDGRGRQYAAIGPMLRQVFMTAGETVGVAFTYKVLLGFLLDVNADSQPFGAVQVEAQLLLLDRRLGLLGFGFGIGRNEKGLLYPMVVRMFGVRFTF